MTVLTIPQTIAYAQAAGFTGTSLQRIVAICICESGLRTDAIGPVGEVGIGQIYLVDHPNVTRACALDPACNLKACYAISKNGTDFTPWTTYRNGCSDTKMPLVTLSMLGNPTIATTLPPTSPSLSTATGIKQVPKWCEPFMAHDVAWWEANGHHYPKDWGAAEGGVDWTPDPNDSTNKITALLGGTVVGSGYFCKPAYYCGTDYRQCTGGAQGYGVVTIRSANPYPNIVPGTMIDIYYQHVIIDPSIGLTCAGASGQQIQAGQVIASPNGQYNIEVGINVGTEWGRIWGGQSPGPHADPIPYLQTLIGSGVPVGGIGSAFSAVGGVGGLVPMFSGLTDTILTTTQQASQLINEVPGFLGVCEALDIVGQFVPFTLPAQGLQDAATASQPGTFNLFGWDTGVPNPIAVEQKTQSAIQLPADSIQAVLVFTVTNFVAFAVRATFVTVGLILLFALLFNIGSKAMNIEGNMQTAEKLLPLLA